MYVPAPGCTGCSRLRGLRCRPPGSGRTPRPCVAGCEGLGKGARPGAAVLRHASQRHPISVLKTEFTGDDATVLVGFGLDHTQLDVTSVADVQAAVDAMRPGRQVIEVAAHDWMKDPLSRTTWMTHRPGQLTRDLAGLQQPAGLVHFASSDNASLWRGLARLRRRRDRKRPARGAAGRSGARTGRIGRTRSRLTSQPGLPRPISITSSSSLWPKGRKRRRSRWPAGIER
jgi:hypothetical protein